MKTAKRIYHRTQAGNRALRRASGLSAAHRRALSRIAAATRSDHLRCDTALAALEGNGLVESVPMKWLEDLYRLGDYEPTPLPGD